MSLESYVPQPGTIPAKVLAYLQSKPAGFYAAKVIASDLDTDDVIAFMGAAERAGSIVRERIDGRVHYRLGDGTPPPKVDDDDDADQVGKRMPKAPTAAAEKINMPRAVTRKIVGPSPEPAAAPEVESPPAAPAPAWVPVPPPTLKPAPVPPPPPPAAEKPELVVPIPGPEGARFALWSDGALHIARGAFTLKLSPDEANELEVYLRRVQGPRL